MGEKEIPQSHPRYNSLMQRARIEKGVRLGITHLQGLIAQGRGEAYDYLLGERTIASAREAIRAAAAQLLIASHPVLSVNGNVAALCPEAIAELSNELNCAVETNLFYSGDERKRKIVEHMKKYGVDLLGVGAEKKIPSLDSKRAAVSEEGIWKADVVFVPLEDGDRTEALCAMGKKVIVVDLSPRSRSARKADICIVDNVVRCVPLLIEEIHMLKNENSESLQKIVSSFSNKRNLRESLNFMKKQL